VAWSSESNPDLEKIDKGCRAYVTGRLRTQRHTDAAGNERNIYEIVASTVQLVSE
jgi:single-stranded DNA-binding protein